MSSSTDADRLQAVLDHAVDHLVDRQVDGTWWCGHLSSSALATATAVSALSTVDLKRYRSLVDHGADWLQRHANDDGGWGDTPDSPSNLPTTLLSWAALRLAGTDDNHPVMNRARAYVQEYTGSQSPDLVDYVTSMYGDDRTFAVPILMNLALADLVAWHRIPGLPVELAALPRGLFKAVRLEVVSYALPALIAIGTRLEHQCPSGSALRRALRGLTRRTVLRRLGHLQPASGGYLEAIPLTSFVTMALAGTGARAGDVIDNALRFITTSVRRDGSWPIDSNLSVWLTTHAVCALEDADRLDAIDRHATARWISRTQVRHVHPYTGARPGGWGWSHLPGSVPDVDDTSGAIGAMLALGHPRPARAGLRWLLSLQNQDGGWPTFCRGWGHLPFDRSAPDLTAHALVALHRAAATYGCNLSGATARGVHYLEDSMTDRGTWHPLWFGNQQHPQRSNPVLGCAMVLEALGRVAPGHPMVNRAVESLLARQHEDGSWGGDAGLGATIEETAWALASLASIGHSTRVDQPVERAADWLADRVEDGTWTQAAPLGLYFASLWYSERLYGPIWTVRALGRVVRRHTTQERKA